MWRGGIHGDLWLYVEGAVFCCHAVFLVCHHSLLSNSSETVRKQQELRGGNLAQGTVLEPLSRCPLLVGMQGKHFHSAKHHEGQR